MTLMDERRAMQVRQRENEPDTPARPGGFLVGDRIAGSSRRSTPLPPHIVQVGPHTLTFPGESPEQPGIVYTYAKRMTDVVAATLLLAVLSLPLAVVALLIYLEDRGPIFYRQTRVGQDGQHFTFYKFRSMVRNADAIKAHLEARNEASGPIFKMKNDPRVTRVGRLLRRSSIDELPQLINVLRGEMSLVGPRPHLPREVALYTERQRERLNVQPGLLCLREVFGRSDVSFEHWIELDLLYIQYRSFRTDMRILLRTIPAVLKAEGAY